MQKLLRWQLTTLLILIPVMLLIGCERARLEPVSEQGTILAFGDSLTVGVGTSANNSYPAVLQQLCDRQVINGGVSGETTAQGVKRLPALLDETQPELLLLLEGGNDILRNHDLHQTKGNLATMIEYAQERGIQVVLLGVPTKNIFSDRAEFYQELADKYQLVLLDDLIADLLRTPGYKSDAIHLNAKGYRALAEQISTMLKQHGALE
jgi:lysophospholipase L1-like esterase